MSVAGSALPSTVVTKAAVPSLLQLLTLFTQGLPEEADCGLFVVFLRQCVLCWRKRTSVLSGGNSWCGAVSADLPERGLCVGASWTKKTWLTKYLKLQFFCCLLDKNMRFHPLSGSSLLSGLSAKKVEEGAVCALYCQGLHWILQDF